MKNTSPSFTAVLLFSCASLLQVLPGHVKLAVLPALATVFAGVALAMPAGAAMTMSGRPSVAIVPAPPPIAIRMPSPRWSVAFRLSSLALQRLLDVQLRLAFELGVVLLRAVLQAS